MIYVINVDDIILAGPDVVVLEKVIKSLGITEEEQRYTFELRDEGEVDDFCASELKRPDQINSLEHKLD